MTNQSEESPTVIRQIELVFLLKKDIDSVNKKFNTQNCLLKRVEKFLRFLTKNDEKEEELFSNSKTVRLKYDQFKRDYRQMKRKRRKLLKQLPQIDLYDKLYDLYESFTMVEVEVDMDEEIKQMMIADGNDIDDVKKNNNLNDINGNDDNKSSVRFGINSNHINKIDDNSNNSNRGINNSVQIKNEIFDDDDEDCDDFGMEEYGAEYGENGDFDNKDEEYQPEFDVNSNGRSKRRGRKKRRTLNRDNYIEDDFENDMFGDGSESKTVFKNSKKMVYQCNYEGCNFVTKWSTSLKCHKKSHNTNQRRYKCNVPGCNYSTHWPNGLRCHKLSHNKEPRFKCYMDNCSYSTNWLDCWKSHKKSHDPERLLKCDFDGCSYVTGWQSGLKRHKLSHFPDMTSQIQSLMSSTTTAKERSRGSLNCDFKGCNYTTNWPVSLNEHKLYHDVVHRFRCDFEGCFFATDKFDNLNTHRMVHIVDQRYKCSVNGCNFETNSMGHFSSHKKRHSMQSTTTAKSNSLLLLSSLPISISSASTSSSATTTSATSIIRANNHHQPPILELQSDSTATSSKKSTVTILTNKVLNVMGLCEDDKDEDDEDENGEIRRTFRCDFGGCDFETGDMDCLREHKTSEHPKESQKMAQVLERSLTRSSRFELSTPQMLTCSYPGCGYEAINLRQLNAHRPAHPSQDPNRLKCSIDGCRYTSNRQSNLNRHILSHLNNTKKYKLAQLLSEDNDSS